MAGPAKAARRQAWRTATIYHTNLRTAYQAGRWETLKNFPFLRYKHNTVRNPREQHKAWDGVILPSDHPWWDTHYTPNGWGCRCTVLGVSAAKMKAMGWKVSEPPAPIQGDPPPEWAYHVGHAASGRHIADSALAGRCGQVVGGARAKRRGLRTPRPGSSGCCDCPAFAHGYS